MSTIAERCHHYIYFFQKIPARAAKAYYVELYHHERSGGIDTLTKLTALPDGYQETSGEFVI